MTKTHVLALALALAGCKAKDKAKDEPKDEPKDVPEQVAAPDAAKAAPTAAVPDAAPPAADAMPVKPAAAGAFYMVHEGPLDASVVIARVDGKPALEGGEFTMAAGENVDYGYQQHLFEVARRFTTPPAESAALVGSRLGLWGISGRKCAATVKEIVAVGAGHVGGELGKRQQEPADTADLVEKLGAEVYRWDATAVLTDVDGDCDEAVFAIADAAKPKLVKVKAAKEWEAAAFDAYDSAGRVQDAHAKHDLEDVPDVKMVSVRKLAAESGPSLALVYANLNERRTIGVFAVPGPTFDGVKYLGSVDAEAPSEVVGGDFDGDGLLDVAIESTTGTAALLGNGDGWTIIAGQVDAPMD